MFYTSFIPTGASIGFDDTEKNVTEGTNAEVELCFSLLQGSFESSSVSLVVDISPTGATTGKFEYI